MITQYQHFQQSTSPKEIQDLHISHLIQNQSDSEHSYSNDLDKSSSKSKPSTTIHSKNTTNRKSKRNNSRKCGDLIKNLKWSTFLQQTNTNHNTSIIENIEDIFDHSKPFEPQFNNNNNQDNISLMLNQNNNKRSLSGGNNIHNNNKLISNCNIKITNNKSHTPINNKRKHISTNVDIEVNSIDKYNNIK